jgi:regulator of sirC expression with transglutaminase-like and TPR domain
MGQARFRELFADAGAEPPLDEVSLAIASALRPGLDEAESLAALQQIANDCPRPDGSSGQPRPEAIAEYLFGDLGFAGNRDAYYDWRNSCLDRVIATRSGIPVSLSILMIEVARRLGVDLVGVGMPSHFLVGVIGEPDLFFDPFEGGRPLDRSDARRLFDLVTQGKIGWNDAHLDPTPNREIVIRMLTNLKVIFAGRADRVRYAVVMQLRCAIPEIGLVEEDELPAATAVFN